MKNEYRNFLESEYYHRKLSLYEKVCMVFNNLKLPLPKSLEERIQNEINFCHLRVTPNAVISTAVFLPITISIFLSLIFYIFGLFSMTMFLMIIILSIIIFYYLFSYTSFLVKHFRAKASAEMSLATIYMSISLKINASLEAAVAFAAANLSGPLGLDLKKLLWDLSTGQLFSVITGIDILSEKWKSESEEFVNALSLLKTAVSEPPERMERTIREAVKIMAEGTKTRMKRYAMAMRNPLKMLNLFGILLPIMVLILFPILVVFVPEIAKPELLIFSYIFFLPITVYLFLRQYFYAKPYSYHQVEIKNLETFQRQKKIATYISIAFGLCITTYLIYQLSHVQTIFSNEQFLYSYLIILILSSSVIVYSFLSAYGNLKKNEEILKMENELPTAFFQLGIASNIGKPIEKNIESLISRIGTLTISKLFKKILTNITTYGMTLESAIFEKNVGVVYSYPSRIIYIALKLLVDISKKGMLFLSMALSSISEFLKDAAEVNAATEEILSETTSDMQIQAWVFAPLSAGIVVGLMAIVIYIFSFFGANLQEIEVFMNQSGLGEAGFSSFSFLLNIGKQIPFHFFQLIVGIYMIEMVFIISRFLGELNYGDDEINKLFELGKIMLVAILVYSVVVLSLYYGVGSFLKLPEGGI